MDDGRTISVVQEISDYKFEVGDLVVYPIYGVGEIENFDSYDIDGSKQDFILINFKQDKMKLRIPKEKASSSGLRKLSNKNRLSRALDVLAEKPSIKKDMWIKRAKEYENKIFSAEEKILKLENEIYNELIKRIKSTFRDEIQILIAPGPNEIKLANDIDANIILDNDKALNICQLSSLIKDSYFVISNDTGPAHMAAHLNVKGLVLFGSHTTAEKVSIVREHFKAIQVADLTKLSADKVFQRMQEATS